MLNTESPVISEEEIRKDNQVYYKVTAATPEQIVCHSRNGATGRWSKEKAVFTPGAFAKFELVKSAVPKSRILTPSKTLLTPSKTLDQVSFEKATAIDWSKEIADSDNVKLLAKANRELKKQLQKQKSGEKLIVDAISEFLESQSFEIEIPKMPNLPNKSDEEIAVLHISDTQIGKVTSTYDKAIAEQRLISLIQKTIKITNMRRSAARIDEIRVYLGGDMVEGEEIFPHQAHEIEESVYDQAMYTAPLILVKCILMLLKNFKKVKVICVPGNHGRNGSRATRANPRTNWDNVCYRTTKLLLLGEKEQIEDRLEWSDNEEWFAVDHVFDWGNLIVHGDQIRGGFGGFPWYGTAKKAWGWIDSIPVPWDYLWFGHFHTYAGPVTLNKRTFLANGTTESDNTYAQSELAAAGFPCQRLTFFNADHGLIADHQIFLTNKRIPSKVSALAWLNEVEVGVHI